MPSLIGYEDQETTFTYCLEVENGGQSSQQGRRFESLTYTCEVCDGDGDVEMDNNDEAEGEGDGDDNNDEDDGDDGDDGEERPEGNRARYKRRRYAIQAGGEKAKLMEFTAGNVCTS
ncbi:hypothetical protein JCM24511_05919 [Saitozyma sp. JCM 24511]|nr:hypothetical protein JCM24511_05919 [Saitozyma sp. JCM 24511]